MLALGALFSLLLYASARFTVRYPVLRYLWWLLLSLLSLVVGLLSAVFWLFWLGTDHDIAHSNENLFLFPIWMLAMPVAAGAMVRGRRWGQKWFWWLSLATLASALVGLGLKVLPWFSQDNWMFVCLLVPVWLTLAWTARAWKLSTVVSNEGES